MKIQYEEVGLRKHTPVSEIVREWDLLKKQHPLSRTSIRVFEGDLYSLFDDDDFYEDNRHLINSTTYSWDSIRELALKEEIEGRIPKNWGSKYIKLTIDEEARLKIAFNDFDKSIDTLANRYGITFASRYGIED